MTAEEAEARLKELGFVQMGDFWVRHGDRPELALIITTMNAVRIAFWAPSTVEGE